MGRGNIQCLRTHSIFMWFVLLVSGVGGNSCWLTEKTLCTKVPWLRWVVLEHRHEVRRSFWSSSSANKHGRQTQIQNFQLQVQKQKTRRWFCLYISQEPCLMSLLTSQVTDLHSWLHISFVLLFLKNVGFSFSGVKFTRTLLDLLKPRNKVLINCACVVPVFHLWCSWGQDLIHEQ